MMLGNDFYRIVICKYGNIGMSFYRFYQAGLYFSSCIVFVVQDTELGMASFFVEVEFSILFLSNPLPIYQFLDLCRCFSHYFSTAARSLIQSPAIIVSSMCFSKLSTFKLVTDAIPP